VGTRDLHGVCVKKMLKFWSIPDISMTIGSFVLTIDI
jgi:hypothetical protein